MKKLDFLRFLKYRLLAIFAIILLMAFSVAHKYYVSITEARIDTKKNTMNLSCKMFTDDLEGAILKFSGKKYDITKGFRVKETNDILEKYIRKHVSVSLDNVSATYEFIGYEIEDDAVWCYLEVEKYKSAKKITIINSLLFDYLPEQINVVQLYIDKSINSKKLINPNDKAEFEL